MAKTTHEVNLYVTEDKLTAGYALLGGIVLMDPKNEAMLGAPLKIRVAPGDTIKVNLKRA